MYGVGQQFVFVNFIGFNEFADKTNREINRTPIYVAVALCVIFITYRTQFHYTLIGRPVVKI